MPFKEPGKPGSDVRLRGSSSLKAAVQEVGGGYEDCEDDGDGGARLEVLNRRNCPASLYACQHMERSRM